MARLPFFSKKTEFIDDTEADDEAQPEPVALVKRAAPGELRLKNGVSPQNPQAGVQLSRAPARPSANDRGHFDSINKIKRQDATPEEIRELLARRTGLLTSSMGQDAIIIDREYRLMGGYFDDGTFVIDRAQRNNIGVAEIRNEIRRSNKPIRRELLVDLEVILEINRNFTTTSTNRNVQEKTDDRERFNNTLQQREKSVIALIKEFADIRASDIHIDIKGDLATIRVRAGGNLKRMRQTSGEEMRMIFSAAFNMATDSDSAFKPREFQGARISNETKPLPAPVQAVRLQFNPVSNNGQYAIFRLLYENSDATTADIDRLGYSPSHLEQIARLRRKPYGINIISGPTGSGKSTTLQNALESLIVERGGEINVLSIEDPPEYNINGAIQMPVVNAKGQDERAAKFTEAISAALRSDPDVIMIGEIRDASSTQLTFTAGLTGHQVWGSLHANNAISILTRLRDNHVEEYKLTDHTLVTGLIGQRLIRRVCDDCSLTLDHSASHSKMDDRLLNLTKMAVGEYADAVRIHNREGCAKCRYTGYSGRTVVAEIICPDEKFMKFIADGKTAAAYNQWIDEHGSMTMFEHSMTKLMQGMATPYDIEERMGDFDQFHASPKRRFEIMNMAKAPNLIDYSGSNLSVEA